MPVEADADQGPRAVRRSDRWSKPQPWLVAAILGSVIAVVGVAGLLWSHRDPYRVGTSHHVTASPIVVCGLDGGAGQTVPAGSDLLPQMAKVERGGRSWYLLSGNLPRNVVVEGELTLRSETSASFRASDVNAEFVRDFAPVGCP